VTVDLLAADTAPVFTVTGATVTTSGAKGAAMLTINENTAPGTLVTTLAASDADEPNGTFTLDRTDKLTSFFDFDPITGKVTVASGATLDFEKTPKFVLTFTVTDDGIPGSTTKIKSTLTLTVNLNNLNEAPAFLSTSPTTFLVAEDNKANTTVGQVKAADPDTKDSPKQVLTYAFVDSTDNTKTVQTSGPFTINSLTGKITVATANALDYETTPSYSLTVRVTDSGTNNLLTGELSTDQPITINVKNINEAPVPAFTAGTTVTTVDSSLLLSKGKTSINIDETVPGGATVNTLVVGTLTFTDQDNNGALTYVLVGGVQDTTHTNMWTDKSGAFQYDSSNGKITVLDATKLSYEATKSVTLNFAVTDLPIAGDSKSKSLTTKVSVVVNLNNLNEAPVITSASSFSIAENNKANATVGQVKATDPDTKDSPKQVLTYAFFDGTTTVGTSGPFTIDPTTGKITIANANALDFETKSNYPLTVRVTDSGTNNSLAGELFTDQSLTIHVTDVNETPTVTLTDKAGNNVSVVPGTTASKGTASLAVTKSAAAVGDLVGTLTFADPDTVAGQTVNTTLTSSTGTAPTLLDKSGAFAFNTATGKLTIADPTKLVAGKSVVLTFTGKDSATKSPLSFTLTLSIAVS
jgi:hypothetical protein